MSNIPMDPQHFQRLGESVDKIAFAVYVFLSREYEQLYDKEYAKLLAVAVSNELFSRPPGNAKGEDFLRHNKDVVAKQTGSVKNFEGIRKTIAMMNSQRLSYGSIQCILLSKNYLINIQYFG